MSEWVTSTTCKLAGCLFIIADKVSVVIVFIIVLCNLLGVRSHNTLHFQRISAVLLSALAWVLGLLTAVVPLTPRFSHWEFYSQSSVCVPLPVTKTMFAGKSFFHSTTTSYSIIFSLLIFVFEGYHYTIVRRSVPDFGPIPTTSNTSRKSFRLSSTAVCEAVCRFPVNMLSVASLAGEQVPNSLNSGLFVFLLPISSVLIPALYGYGIYSETQAKKRDDNIYKKLKASLHGAKSLLMSS
jgi:hypothetical protein